MEVPTKAEKCTLGSLLLIYEYYNLCVEEEEQYISTLYGEL